MEQMKSLAGAETVTPVYKKMFFYLLIAILSVQVVSGIGGFFLATQQSPRAIFFLFIPVINVLAVYSAWKRKSETVKLCFAVFLITAASGMGLPRPYNWMVAAEGALVWFLAASLGKAFYNKPPAKTGDV